MEKKITSRDIRAEERKKELLSAAKELFSEKGYHATSVLSITQKVGMGEGLIYHYFPKGKMEILQTIINDGQRIRQQKISELLFHFRENLPLREILILFARKACEVLTDDKQFLQIIIKEKNLLKENDSQFLSNVIERNKEEIVEFLSIRADRNEIRQMNFDLAAMQFISSVLLIVMQKIVNIKFIEDDLDIYIEKMIDFTLELWAV